MASLEYAVDHLQLGCPWGWWWATEAAGPTAAISSAPLTPLLSDLVAPIRANLEPGHDLDRAIRHNARSKSPS
ncbi:MULTISPECIES: hypothetical protein [unclassified Cyanobium]|uniref:hypothetical protein n=1 Tax=unclassified Cyanobium TaxID=2627006 RepID=UPI0020CC7270|nr:MULTISPECIES: hypothetical protein [unclassified Cyanobium]MCP9858765.1 hypothetical protein [Cyanobium sp. Cruz-8H5]MCP9866001.1 hypothetical protein [Cyanobium sp. Cruz-8D1]